MRRRTLALAVLCLLSWSNAVWAGVGEPSKLAPETTAIYVEVAHPEVFLDPVLAPQTIEMIYQVPAYKEYLESDQYEQAKGFITLLENRLETNWKDGIRDLVGGGLYLAFDPASNTSLLMIRAKRPELVTKLNTVLQEIVAATSGGKGVESKEFHGVMGYKLSPDAYHAILDDLIVICNKADGLKGAIERFKGVTTGSLADRAEFSKAREGGSTSAAWAWASLDTIRQNPGFTQALENKSNNVLLELLVGGILDALREARFATASLEVEGDHIRLKAELPHDPAKVADKRKWFFAPSSGGAPSALRPAQSIGSLTAYRDFSEMWNLRDDLFDDEVLAGFSQADTQLGLYFSGRDFGTEVLGQIEPAWQFVVARQEFSGDQPTPALKLPAFALVLGLKGDSDLTPHLLLAFQNIVGLVNVGGAQEGQPQLLLSTEDFQGVKITKGSYLPDPRVDASKAPVNYNFSPSCAQVGRHIIFGSTVGIVRELAGTLQSGVPATAENANLQLAVDATPIRTALEDNRELLISQNMLEQGHDRAAAEQQIDGLMKIVGLFESASLTLSTGEGTLALEIGADLNLPR